MQDSKSTRTALIGIGFRERDVAFDFKVTFYLIYTLLNDSPCSCISETFIPDFKVSLLPIPPTSNRFVNLYPVD